VVGPIHTLFPAVNPQLPIDLTASFAATYTTANKFFLFTSSVFTDDVNSTLLFVSSLHPPPCLLLSRVQLPTDLTASFAATYTTANRVFLFTPSSVFVLFPPYTLLPVFCCLVYSSRPTSPPPSRLLIPPLTEFSIHTLFRIHLTLYIHNSTAVSLFPLYTLLPISYLVCSSRPISPPHSRLLIPPQTANRAVHTFDIHRSFVHSNTPIHTLFPAVNPQLPTDLTASFAATYTTANGESRCSHPLPYSQTMSTPPSYLFPPYTLLPVCCFLVYSSRPTSPPPSRLLIPPQTANRVAPGATSSFL